MSGTERDKTLHTIDNKPWVKIVSVNLDENDPGKGSFELDWNSYFIESLNDAGYSGRTDEDVVNMWFNDLCRGVLAEEIEDEL